MAEILRTENLESEKTPEKVVADAVSAIESKDLSNPVLSSEFIKKSKEFFTDSVTVAGARVGSLVALKAVWGVFQFALEFAKKGKVSFGEGYKIGQEIFDFDSKKDKK